MNQGFSGSIQLTAPEAACGRLDKKLRALPGGMKGPVPAHHQIGKSGGPAKQQPDDGLDTRDQLPAPIGKRSPMPMVLEVTAEK